MKKIITILALLIASLSLYALPNAETDGVNAVKSWAFTRIADAENSFKATGKTRAPSPGFWGSEIVYLIQVDRFNNGDTSNDNLNLPPIQQSSNGTDLYNLQDFRNGGDIRGIIQRLDYLKDLGVTAIWVTPIIKHNGDYHGYLSTDFTQIDPGFGTNEEFREMVQEAHKRNIKVIMDIVVNHMADRQTSYSKYPDHYGAADGLNAKYWNGQGGGVSQQGTLNFGSTFFPPFRNQEFFNRAGSNSQADMEGTGSAAVFGDFFAGMYDFDTRSWDFQDIFTNLHKYWIAYADVDGFRLDAAKHVTADFVAYFSTEIRNYAKSIGKDNFYIVGEVAGPPDWIGQRLGRMFSDPNNPYNHGIVPATLTNRIVSVKDKYLANPKATYPGMNAAYDFAFGGTSRDVLQNAKNVNEIEIYYRSDYFKTLYTQNDPRLNWNVLEIHDWPRITREFKNNPWKSQLALSYLLSFQGIPVINYGMEQGFCGVGHTDNINAGAATNDMRNVLNDLGNHSNYRQDMFISGPWRLGSTVGDIDKLAYVGKAKPYVWYDWTTDPYLNRNHSVYKTARKFNYIRQSSDALRYGSTTYRWGDYAKSGLMAFSRIDNGKEVVVVVNTASWPIAIPKLKIDNGINGAAGQKYVNMLNGTQAAYTGKEGTESYLYPNGLNIEGNSVIIFAHEFNLTAWNSDLGCFLMKDYPQTPPKIITEKDFKWSGNVETYPENGSIDASSEIWINLETFAIGSIASVNLLYSINDSTIWTTVPMELAAPKNGNDWWHVSIGKKPINTKIKYKFEITDKYGIKTVNDNKGVNYLAAVNGNPGEVTYLGGTYNYPANGSINSTNDFWINTVTKPLSAKTVVKAVYSLDGAPFQSLVMTTDGTTTDGGQKWHVSLGKLASGTTIDYYVEAYDAAGTTLLLTDKGTSGTNYSAKVNGVKPGLNWIGSVYHYPPTGSIKNTDDFWVNVQTATTGAAVKVEVKYTIKNTTTITKTALMERDGFSGDKEMWHLNLGKFPAETIIEYEFFATDAVGKTISPNLVYTAQVNKSLGGFVSGYPQVYVRGTSNGWSLSGKMTLIGDNLWQTTQTFGSTTTERFKFDIKGDWTLNFGDLLPANGIADSFAADIPITQGAGEYIITFNDSTKAYTVEKKAVVKYNAVVSFDLNTTEAINIAGLPVIIKKSGSANQYAAGTIGSGNTATFSLENGTYTAEVNSVIGSKTITGKTDISVTDKDTTASAILNVTTKIVSVYPQVYFRGTPNGWIGTEKMTLISDNTWQITKTFAGAVDDRFKFDINGDWSVNFGDNIPADKIADLGASKDIYITEGAGDYTITFNDNTKAYSLSKKNVVKYDAVFDFIGATGVDLTGVTVSVKKSGSANVYSTAVIVGNKVTIPCENGSYNVEVNAVVGGKIVSGSKSFIVTDTATLTTVSLTVSNPLVSTYKQVYFRGTPNNWQTTDKMVLVADYTWEITKTFGSTTTERFKFDINGDWGTNFGDNAPANGVADPFGADIKISAAGTYKITFNDSTKVYTVVKQ